MKRILITLYVLASVVLTAVAQARFTSNTEMYSFGQIEWKHPVTVQYTITNTGDQPLVLTEVEPDCACSVAQWTKTPIAPGAKGTVNVTFDAKALGHFQKSVAIYSNAQPNLVYLKFNGEVVQEIKDFTKTHPYLIGQIRIDKNSQMCIRDREYEAQLNDEYAPIESGITLSIEEVTLPTAVAVSYTHLDVYKRQRHYCFLGYLLEGVFGIQ